VSAAPLPGGGWGDAADGGGGHEGGEPTGPDDEWTEPGDGWDQAAWWAEPGGGHHEAGPQGEAQGDQAQGDQAQGDQAQGDQAQGEGAGFGPWETYETGEAYGWTGGYGVVAGQGWAQSHDDAEPPDDEDRSYPAPGAAGTAEADAAAGPGPGYYPGAGAYRPPEDDAGPPAAGYAAGPGTAPTRGGAPDRGAPAYGGVPDHTGALEHGSSYRSRPPEDGHQAGNTSSAGEGQAVGAHSAWRWYMAGDARPPGSAQAGPGEHAAYGVVPPDAQAPPNAEAPPDAGARPGQGSRPEWQAESADSLTAESLLRGRHAAPKSGWRRTLYQVTGGLVRAPQSAADRRRQDLVQRARTPVAGGHHRVAVLSLKGGVGKTTTTVGLGSTLASLRGDRVIAVDANPDRGTLCDKLRLETAATVRDLLNEEDQIQRYADVRAYTTQAASGLEVLASDRDPTVSVAFSDRDYEDVAQVLEHYYSVSITDCGTGLLHSAMAGVLRLADQIVLVSSPSVDGARSASATLDWLAAHRYGDLVRGAVVVLSAIRSRSKSGVDLARLEQHFAARCRAVVRVPYDAHLEEGAEVDLALLSRATADAYLVLAAEVGDGFSWPRP
jgi:MinD-like ATPase involved in chromosome partitioning or flagellar assembly